MTSLVDRYVYTTLRRVPERQRADIDRELRAAIQDAVDARVESGESLEAAIENTLIEFGDPDRLADRYAERANYLIGPELYGAWRRLMLVMFTVVLPIIVSVTAVVRLFDNPSVGAVIGQVIGTTFTVGAHLAFWTTLVFAVIERTGAGRAAPRTTWSPKDLPDYESGALTPMQLAVNLVWLVLLIAALVLQQFTFTDVPVLDPDNWSFWWPFLIAVLVLRGVYTVWIYRLGSWTRTAAVVNAALALLFAAPTIWLLATDRFFNPAFSWSTDLGSDDPERWITMAAISVIVLNTVWEIGEVTLRAERARRGLPTQVPGTGSHNIG